MPRGLVAALLTTVLAGGAAKADPFAVPFEAFLEKQRRRCAERSADAVCQTGRHAESGPSVLVVGLDGVNWAVVDPLLRGGALPGLARLVAAGARAKLDCVPAAPRGCYDPPLWNAIATGRSAFEHGMLSLEATPDQRRAPTLWSVLRRHGGRVGLAGFRNTWPPEPDVDWVLTEPGRDWLAKRLWAVWPEAPNPRGEAPARRTRPPDLFETLGLLPASDERLPIHRTIAADRLTMETVLRQQIAERYGSGEPSSSLVYVHLSSPDVMGHFMWGSIQKSTDAPIDEQALLDQAAAWKARVYQPGPFGWEPVPHRLQEIDAWLTRLLSLVPYDYVVVHSDHGMGRSRKPGALPGIHTVLTVPDSRYGIFVLTGPGVVAGRQLDAISILDLAPTLAYLLELPVAKDLPGQVRLKAFSEEHRGRHPVRHTPSWKPAPEPDA